MSDDGNGKRNFEAYDSLNGVGERSLKDKIRKKVRYTAKAKNEEEKALVQITRWSLRLQPLRGHKVALHRKHLRPVHHS